MAAGRDDWDVLLAIAIGGVAGSLARWGIGTAVPQGRPDDWPWATLGVNVVGCLLMGVLMWFVLEAWGQRRYARPFLGVGFLGGFTTFSAFAVESRALLAGGAPLLGLAYLLASVLLGLLAVRAGYLIAGRFAPRRGDGPAEGRETGG